MFEGKEAISIHVLPFIVFGNVVIFWGVRSVAMLVLYGREPIHGED